MRRRGRAGSSSRRGLPSACSPSSPRSLPRSPFFTAAPCSNPASPRRAPASTPRAPATASARPISSRSHETRFDAADHDLGSWSTFPARQLPVVGPQLRTLERIASIGARTIPLARSTATNIDPDRLRLVDGRLDLATLASYRPIFDRLAVQTRAVRAELGGLQRTWLVPALDHQLVRFESTVARADDSAQTADEAVRLAPDLLGASGTRTYLVSFVTPAEARGSGGLMANYGVLTATKGRIHLEGVGRGPDLDGRGQQPKHLTGPADYLAALRQVPTRARRGRT